MQQIRLGLIFFLAIAIVANAQTPLSWQQVQERFVANNPTLRAARLGIDESQAQEVTAYLRPNPDVGLSADGVQIVPEQGMWRPLSGVVITSSLSYLYERQHKRELRRDTARESTVVTQSQYTDQERNLLFNLRAAFVNTLQSKAVLQNARENLAYWDRELEVNRLRFNDGAMSRADLTRLELQRAQFVSDYETASVNLRTAKIQLLMLLNERTPLEQFDVAGEFDFREELRPLEEFRKIAIETRPDLKAAVQNVELAKLTHQLANSNGSTDPTWSVWYSQNASFNNPLAHHTVGASVNVPLRIFDRNQGEKARTQLDIGKNERQREATEAQIFNDVDSAYWTLIQNVNVLKPYKDEFLKQATEVRDTVAYSYQRGAATLLDLLDAEKAYRDTRLAYVNLIGSYLTAAAQMNMATGREVMP